MITEPSLAEAHRLRALHALGILDTPAEERFDRVTRLAQRLFDVPIALIGLVDTDRQWFKSCIGLDVRQAAREVSFCSYAVAQNAALVIDDAMADRRFSANPAVTGDAHIRAYAGQPLRDAEGRPLGTLCVIDRRPRAWSSDDIRALRDLADCAEAELNAASLSRALAVQRESEARVRAVMDSVVDGIVTFDGLGTILGCNRAAERIFGYDPDALIGQPVRLLAEIRGPSGSVPTGAGLAAGVYYDLQGRRRNGAAFPLDLTVCEMQIEAQHHYIGIFRDNTERAKAEEAYTKTEHLYRSVIEQTSDCVCLIDAQSSFVLEANGAMHTLLGYGGGELSGMRIHEIMGDDRQQVDLLWRRLMAERRLSVGERRYRRKDGSTVEVEVAATLIHSGGQPICCIVARDSTERIEARWQIERQRDFAVQVMHSMGQGLAITDAEGPSAT